MPSSLNNTSNASDKMELGNRNLNVIQIAKERNVMAFVNEFASDEDIKKYDLNGIWDQYHPLRKGRYYSGQRPMYTIDRDSNIFFMLLGLSDRDNPGRTRALLWFGGYHVLVEMDLIGLLNPEGIKSNPYRMRWELVGIHPQKKVKKSNNEIIIILKEALTVYGFNGANRQLPNTIVEFNF